MSSIDIDTSQIKEWRSIITLIVFVITNILVLFPVRLPVYLPTRDIRHALVRMRVLAPRQARPDDLDTPRHRWTKCQFRLDLVTAPIIADLFLLAILAIGREEVHDGTVGANGIAPIDIMVFFFTLAYIAISIDATGLIRYLAFRVLQKGGKNGYLLYFYLFAFFFALATAIGNDPIVLSGTPFLAYMTRAARNIDDPRAWLYAAFCVANTGSAILVSSNPTNLVLAGSFEIKFVEYTANMIVPVVVGLTPSLTNTRMYLPNHRSRRSSYSRACTSFSETKSSSRESSRWINCLTRTDRRSHVIQTSRSRARPWLRQAAGLIMKSLCKRSCSRI